MPRKRSNGEGGLYPIRGGKLWRGVAYLPEPDPVTGKRVQRVVTARTKTACRTKLDALKAEIAEHGAPLDKRVTVTTWSERWLNDHALPHVDPNTYNGYSSAVRRWIIPTIGHKPIAALKPSDVTAVHVRLRAAGRATSTARGVHVVLSRMLEQARREGLAARNVAEFVDPPGGRGAAAGKRKRRTRTSLPLADAAAILRVSADDDLASLWWLKLLGGPRQGELLGAALEDWDPERRTYAVSWKLEQVARMHGCGPHRTDGQWSCGKAQGAACPGARWRIPDDFEMRHLSGRWCLTRPKSVEGRIVPVLADVAERIDDYIARHADRPNPHGLIWRKDDGMPYFPTEDAQEWRNVLHRAGVINADQLAPGRSPVDGHMARHTTVTLMALTGTDPQLIGEIVGHSSREVTEIYRHADPSEKAAAIQLLGNLVLGPTAAAPRALGAG